MSSDLTLTRQALYFLQKDYEPDSSGRFDRQYGDLGAPALEFLREEHIKNLNCMERATRIELAFSTWEADESKDSMPALYLTNEQFS